MMDLGHVAYRAYFTATGGRSLVDRSGLPRWEDLLPEFREAWRATADGVRMFLELAPPQLSDRLVFMECHQRGPEYATAAELLAAWGQGYAHCLPVERRLDGSLRFLSNRELNG